MSRCNMCNTHTNLVFAINPLSFATVHLCECCYAKKYFPTEYPNLSRNTMQHIKMLPHVPFTSFSANPPIITIAPLSFQALHNSEYIQNVQTPSNVSVSNAEMGGNTNIFNSFQKSNPNPMLSRLQNQDQPPLLQQDKFHLQRTHSIDNSVSTTQSSSSNSTSTSMNNIRKQAPTQAEIAIRLNDFIKRTLFPDKMEIPDLTPNAKNPRVDIDTDVEPEEEEDTSDWPFEWIGGDVKSIRDLIRIGKEYKVHPKRVHTNLDLVKLSKLVEPLETLQTMVGLEDIKASIFKQVVFHLQDLDNGNKDMHHTVIKGPPGVGKTQISHIIARIYKGLGFLKKDTVVSVKRDDLIAGYLGQTAMKAKKKYEEALGGVLLIDEAYALGDGSDKDSYSKEAIDLLTSYLSEHGHEFICIIAGYKEALEKRFFSVNEGLARRFNIHYEIKPYSGTDICQIFQKLVADGGWQLDASAYNPEFFVKNRDAFPHFGGDMQTLFAYTKKAHSSRLLAVRTKEQLMNTKKKINMDDLEAGFEQYTAGNGYAAKDTQFEAKFMYM